jgi:hypothetical protein
MPLTGRSATSAPDDVACQSETSCIQNVISNLRKIVLGFGRQNIKARPARCLYSRSSRSVSSVEVNVSPSTTSLRSDFKNPRSILALTSCSERFGILSADRVTIW